MKILFHLWARLKRLKWDEINRLIVLTSTIFVLSMSLCLWDISASSFLLQTAGLDLLGADYLLAAIVWIGAACAACSLKRHLGFGAAKIAFLWLVLLGIAFAFREEPYQVGIHLMFAAKYGTSFLMNFIFWLLAGRFIKISMASLKFIGLCSFELLGVVLGSVLACHVQLYTAFWLAFVGLVLCAVLFWWTGWLLSVKREAFIRKNGGVQDVEDRIIIDVIWALSFFWMCGRLLVEFVMYSYVVKQPESSMILLSQIYGSAAGISLLLLACFARTRFLYTMSLGLIVCVASIGLCALGGIFEDAKMVLGGVVLFFISSHFYMNRYLSLLLRPLVPGKGQNTENMQLLLMIPCAFIFAGALLLQFDFAVLNWVLLADMAVLAFLFIISGHLYGRQLMKLCALKRWQDGPFLLAYPPLQQMIRQGLSKKNAAEAIYYLSLVDEGYIANYRRLLDQMLEHPAISVRLFVLKKLNKLSLTLKEKHLLSALMKKDACAEVQNMALACLIRDALETNGSAAWLKYKEYVEDKQWVRGVCCGFLYGRGVWLEKILNKVFKLADSSKEQDNLMALSIMAQHPRFEWTDKVDKLLNSTHVAVVKMAMTVAGKMASTALLKRLLPLLDDVRWRDSVLETLSQYGKQAFPSIEKAITNEKTPASRQKMLILFLGSLPSGEGKQMLLRLVFQTKRMLRQVIIESLGDSGILWVHQDRKRILRKVIDATAKEWQDIYQMLAQTENLQKPALQKVKTLFQEALQEELNRTRALILNQIGFYNLNSLAQQAVAVLKNKKLNDYAAAVGCLQDILPKKMYQQTKDILLYPIHAVSPITVAPMTEQVFLNYFILNPPGWVSAWLKALALYGWRELNDKMGVKAAEIGLKSSDWVVLESALSALGRLEKDATRKENLVLNVPTRYLLKQNFENLLEGKDANHN